MTQSIAPKFKSDLSEAGYAIIRYPDSINIAPILGELGDIIQTTEIRENPKNSRLLVSNQPMDFHTDHHSARFVAWRCNSQSVTGGESLLVDIRPVLSGYPETMLSLLMEINVKTHKVFYDDKLSLRLLSATESQGRCAIYYASWLVENQASIRHAKALEKFQSDLMQAKPTELLLSEGDLLIIDNHRLLHGRKGFPMNSNRWLTRYWIKHLHTDIF